MVKKLNASIESIMTDNQPLAQLAKDDVALNELATAEFGTVTLTDIIKELEKPGRDPRPAFKTATFKEGVNTIKDLTVGMILEGVISNVANFGAFVDVGVHQDGLVHISSLSNKFVSDPREIVKAGDVVKVKVMEVDAERKRINLTMRLDEEIGEVSKQTSRPATNASTNTSTNTSTQKHVKPAAKSRKDKESNNAAMGNAFADAFAKLKK
jgi:uncharacterized protein